MPTCPKCNSKLVKRTNRKTGEHFYGCSSYPDCSYTTAYYVEISESACRSGELRCIECPLYRKPQCYMLKGF